MLIRVCDGYPYLVLYFAEQKRRSLETSETSGFINQETLAQPLCSSVIIFSSVFLLPSNSSSVLCGDIKCLAQETIPHLSGLKWVAHSFVTQPSSPGACQVLTILGLHSWTTVQALEGLALDCSSLPLWSWRWSQSLWNPRLGWETVHQWMHSGIIYKG